MQGAVTWLTPCKCFDSVDLKKKKHNLSWQLCFLKYKFIYFNWRLITLQYCIGVAIHQRESTTGVHVFPIMNPFPTSLSTPIPLGHPSAPAPSILYPASNLDWWFISYMILYMFQCHFSQIIPPSPSPTESKRLFYTSISLLLSRIQGYHYHLSKFHMYALVYCFGVFVSGLHVLCLSL